MPSYGSTPVKARPTPSILRLACRGQMEAQRRNGSLGDSSPVRTTLSSAPRHRLSLYREEADDVPTHAPKRPGRTLRESARTMDGRLSRLGGLLMLALYLATMPL